MLYPLGLSHSNMKMEPAAAWTATITTSIHEEKSKGSRKAVAEMIPVLLETRMVIPVSRNGTEKSMTDSLNNKTGVRKICLEMNIRLEKGILYDPDHELI